MNLKRKAAPTSPKPNTELPNDLTWAWSEELKQWIAIKKEDTYAVTDKNNIAQTNNYQSNSDAVNYTSAALEKILASMLGKEQKRSEIIDEEDYFNCLFASELIKLSGIDLNTKEPKFKISKKGYNFLKKFNYNELNK